MKPHVDRRPRLHPDAYEVGTTCASQLASRAQCCGCNHRLPVTIEIGDAGRGGGSCDE